MQGLDDLTVLQHLQHLRRIEDVHMDVLCFFLMLFTHFLHTGGKESIREVVVVRGVGRKGHEELPFPAFVTRFFG